MRSFREFIVDIAKKPPILFPLVALFHILWLLMAVWSCHNEPFPSFPWLDVLWLTAYSVFWIAACDMRKWGALGYIFLMMIDTLLFLAIRNGKLPVEYKSSMLFVDALFSIPLLYYYKRFR